MTLRHIATIAGLTIREIVRRRVVWVLIILAVASVALVGWGVERLVALSREEGTNELQIRLGVSQVLIFIAFMFSFVLAMSAAFLAAPAIGSDVESGMAFALLARPIRRSAVVIGRWVGLATVVGAYAMGSGLLAIAVVGQVTGYLPPEPLTAVAFLAGEAIVVLTLSLALGTRLPGMAAGAISVVAFGLAWFAGVLGGVAAVLDAPSLANAMQAVRLVLPTDGLWRGVVHGLEPPLVDLLAAGRRLEVLEANPFFASSPPPPTVVAWAGVWIVLVLAVGAALFARREL